MSYSVPLFHSFLFTRQILRFISITHMFDFAKHKIRLEPCCDADDAQKEQMHRVKQIEKPL